ncbi:16S rRNA (cytosine(1402)-N(4))-methyltransferase RsmH [Eubacteriales bacterium OttesenSCG-928-M02]|nr:16S rRNA (cytosine(1402)-N(4))-methyltransferase RsmH [Eubacteriales bacterium OttesenSCG-928-M02]
MGYTHKPVLAQECIALLNIQMGDTVVDGTLGLGGHASLILPLVGENGRLIGIDQDERALAMAKERLGDKPTYLHTSFFSIKEALAGQGIETVNGILLDLGVSSYQLDDATRGFSYMQDGPLDMRMNGENPLTARDVVNTYSQEDLERIIKEYGEERWARRIAQFIVEKRQQIPIETSFQLVDVIKAAIPKGARRDGPHPAKRTYQAIRVEVNNELDGLTKGLLAAMDCLSIHGTLCVITFHSLEDRIVKQVFMEKSRTCSCPPEAIQCTCDRIQRFERVTKKPITPSEAELEENPRARSAKLRAIRRLAF